MVAGAYGGISGSIDDRRLPHFVPRDGGAWSRARVKCVGIESEVLSRGKTRCSTFLKARQCPSSASRTYRYYCPHQAKIVARMCRPHCDPQAAR